MYFKKLITEPQSDTLGHDPYYQIQLEYMNVNKDNRI